MKIFISWSGDVSHQVAHALRDWLHCIVKSAELVSSDDIPTGARWNIRLGEQLEEANFGIICVTRSNIKSQWLNFESGALSKFVDCACVMPFLFQLDSTQIEGPLEQFEAATCRKDDLFKLLSRINAMLRGEHRLEDKQLKDIFEDHWPRLQKKFKGIGNCGVETEKGYDWLYPFADIVRIKPCIQCKSIWVVTPFLYRDIKIPAVQEIIAEKLRNGVEYTFVIPSDTDRETQETVKKIFASHPDQLNLVPVPKSEFRKQAVTHYLVLGPDIGEPYTPRVFLELPIDAPDFWIEVRSEAAFGFVDRFRELINKHMRQRISATPSALPAGVVATPA